MRLVRTGQQIAGEVRAACRPALHGRRAGWWWVTGRGRIRL